MKQLKGIEIFAGSQSLTKHFINAAHLCSSLDHIQVRGQRKLDFKMDFFEIPKNFFIDHGFDFVWFGMPCTAFSKASGGLHFDKEKNALTTTALTSNKIAQRISEMILENPHLIWYIENPAGGFYSSKIYKECFSRIPHFVYRITLASFGFPTQKQTDIFTNSNVPLLTNPVTRKNGRYQKNKFDNLTLRQRQCYPDAFCQLIVDNLEQNFQIQLLGKKT